MDKSISGFFKRWQHKIYDHRMLWPILIMISACTLVDVPTANIFGFSTTYVVIYIAFVSAFKSTIILAICSLLIGRHRLLDIIVYSLIVLYGIVGMVNAISFVLYGFGVSHKLMVILSQTNPIETKEFLPGLFSNFSRILDSCFFYITLLAILLIFVGIKSLNRKCFLFIASVSSIFGAAMFGTLCHSYPYGRATNFMILRIPRYAYRMYTSEKAMQQILSKKIPFPDSQKVSAEYKTHNIILVLGESASRNHHSLYGYHLKTNPKLESLHDSIFVFNNVIGSSTSTSGNMERILTFKEDDRTYGDWYKYPSIVDLFKTAGYKTFWLSNQARTGLMSNESGAISSSADVIKYMGAENTEEALTYNYDGILLPEIQSTLLDTAPYKMIFVHLIGSHTMYSSRFPNEFKIFSAADEMTAEKPWLTDSKAGIIADYDNSIAYTDYLLAEIINYIANDSVPGIMMYFSDHGENVYDDHDFIGRDKRHVEVPFIIYPNEAFLRNNPDIVHSMLTSVSRPVSTANVIYSLMTVAGISYPLYNPQKDFLSGQFKALPRFVDEHVWDFENLESDNCD